MRPCIHQPHTLQWCNGWVLQTGEWSVATVESCQHEFCHYVGADVTTEQLIDLTLTSQLEEAGLCHLGHVGLHPSLQSRWSQTGCRISVPKATVLLDSCSIIHVDWFGALNNKSILSNCDKNNSDSRSLDVAIFLASGWESTSYKHNNSHLQLKWLYKKKKSMADRLENVST